MKKTLKIMLMLILASSVTLASNSNSCTTIDCMIASQEEPKDFDSEYIHDEAFVQLKKKELVADLSNDYEKIDNYILFTKLMESFDTWKGTKYSWGGDSRAGIDCSALTRRVYREVFGYELPRVSIDQVKQGKVVTKENLKPGDILFFRPRNSVNHTAVYLGNSLFINASSSQGVVLSSLENSYWKQYFKYGVRVEQARHT